ncbi:hypothetical protein B296_00019278 [Ensete ventricosum]|uniref:Uncharacterized protein n=1 Tax=Ensete ventricosum TaxID=4639 RepID=A0A426ZTV2_ENSVE|nr:hypothetical protein B296_00019278 [Ensete ventricosum]
MMTDNGATSVDGGGPLHLPPCPRVEQPPPFASSITSSLLPPPPPPSSSPSPSIPSPSASSTSATFPKATLSPPSFTPSPPSAPNPMMVHALLSTATPHLQGEVLEGEESVDEGGDGVVVGKAANVLDAGGERREGEGEDEWGGRGASSEEVIEAEGRGRSTSGTRVRGPPPSMPTASPSAIDTVHH